MYLKLLVLILVFAASSLVLTTAPTDAQDQINYISNPDELTVFLNNVVFVRDHLRVPLGVETQIVLPSQTIQDTLILRDEEGRLPLYGISQQSGQILLTIQGQETDESESVRNLTLEYITQGGIQWKPLYNMNYIDEQPETVRLDFFAEIRNEFFTLQSTKVNLVAGAVSVSGEALTSAAIGANNMGFSDIQATATPFSAPPSNNSTPTNEFTTQYVYELEQLDSRPGDTLYVELLEEEFPSRRVLLWNAYVDQEIRVVYKVQNTSTTALTQGIVRTYNDGLFTGSDAIENVPSGSEGSITVGYLRDIRVRREVIQTTVPAENPVDENDQDVQYDYTLTLTNFTDTEQEVEVVDNFPREASDFEFSPEPEILGGNVLRWLVTIPAGEELTLTYSYRRPY